MTSRPTASQADLHVAVSGWLLGQPSGANRRLLALLHHTAPLLADGERVTVLHSPGYSHPEVHPRIAWHAVPIPPGPPWRRIAAERRHLARELDSIGANVLDHGLLPLPRVSIPACLLLHDLRATAGLTQWPRWLARRLVIGSATRAAAVVVPSQFTAMCVREVMPAIAPIVIQNGLDRNDTATAQPPMGTPLATAAGYLLHVGHLEPRKNLGIVIRALATMPTGERPDLVLVGRDAGEHRAIESLAKELGIRASIHWRGVLGVDEVAALHLAARAIVVPSLYEGFGFAALDGLAFGRPTLVANTGALPEVVGDQGVCLPATDPAAWARAIAGTEHDSEHATALRRQRAAEFSWARSAVTTLVLWRRVCAGSLR